MNTFSTWIREEGIVHPCDARHGSDLRSNNTPEWAVLYLIEEDIEGIGAMTLVGAQCVVAWNPEVAS
jgi:hypothetical protein